MLQSLVRPLLLALTPEIQLLKKRVDDHPTFVSKFATKSSMLSKYPSSSTLELWSPAGKGFQILVGDWQIS